MRAGPNGWLRRSLRWAGRFCGGVAIFAVVWGLVLWASGSPSSEPRPDPSPVPGIRELDGMRFGLATLIPNAERAFATAGLPLDPRDLTLRQLEAIHDVLSHTIEVGKEERERIMRIAGR